MDLKKRVREGLLNEGKDDSPRHHEYGCVMVYLDYDKSEWKAMQDLIAEEDLYTTEGDDSYGRETEPHVTVLYGLHEEVSDEDVKSEIDKVSEPKIKLGKISAFENDDFDVLKFDIDSSDLHDLNKVFTGYPHTTNFPDYHPHTTISYVKAGKAKEYIDKLNKEISIDVTPEKFVYSKTNGEKKNYKLG